MGGDLPPGYCATGFNSKTLVMSLARNFAKDHETDRNHGAKHSDLDSDQPSFSKKTTQRLNKQRSAFATSAIGSGQGTPDGYAMVAADHSFERQGSEMVPHAMPALSHDQVRMLNFPPQLVKKDGKPAPLAKQICKHSWRSEKCTTPDCPRRHGISKKQFLEELAEGTNQEVPFGRAPATPPTPSTPSSVTGSANSASSTLDDQRLKLLEEQVKAQTDLLQQIVANQLAGSSAGGNPEADALRKRREASAQKRAMLTTQLRELHEEETAIAGLTAAISSPPPPPSGGSSNVLTPSSEAFWSDAIIGSVREVLHDRTKAQGLPLSRLRLVGKASLTCTVMWDTGCTPPALICLNTLYEWTKQGEGWDINHFAVPKTISGVGPQAVLLIGTCKLTLATSESREITIEAGVMSNGGSPHCDILVGNYYMRHDWDYQIDREVLHIRTPPDGGSAFSIPITWTFKPSDVVAMASSSVNLEDPN